jgi:hypothetical protein
MTAIEWKQNFEKGMKKINPLPLRGEGSVVKPSSGHWNQMNLCEIALNIKISDVPSREEARFSDL